MTPQGRLTAMHNDEQVEQDGVRGALLVLFLTHFSNGRSAVGDNIDKGCIIDYCARHGGVSLNGAARYLGVAKTNRCSVCRRPGHNKNHCPGAGWI